MTPRPGRSRVRAVFIGTGEFGLEALRALGGAAEIDLAGVVTAPARPSGRGGRLRHSPVERLATEFGVESILTPERLRRFFTKQDGGYRVSKTIRDLCVFARQDLTRDPPLRAPEHQHLRTALRAQIGDALGLAQIG